MPKSVSSKVRDLQGAVVALRSAKPVTSAPKVRTPIRPLNTVFQPSPARGVAVFYSISAGAGNATYKLKVDASPTPSTVRAQLDLTNNQVSAFVFFVPAGHYVIIEKTGPGQDGQLFATELEF